MNWHWSWVLCGLLVLGAAAWVEAASLVKLNVVPDGSTQPPGDRLDVSVLCFPGEDEVVLEARAFVRLQGAGDQVTPVAASGDAAHDPDGNLLIRTSVRRPADSLEADARLVVPYASLKLPKGRHQLGYEIRGLVQGRVDFLRATPLSVVVVSDRTRTEIRQREERTVPKKTRKEVTAYTVREGKVVEQQVEIESDELRPVAATRTVKVEIPGEFSRPRTFETRAAPPREADSVRGSVVPLEGRAWSALSEFEAKPKRILHFATNRVEAQRGALAPARFGSTAGPALVYGDCLVNIPVEAHTRGQLEVPSHWWQRRDPRKYFLVEALQVFPRDEFLRQVAPDDVLLFVHGYNTDFESAVLRGAQLVHDLRFPGKAVVFSWPSAGALSEYPHDETEAAKSTQPLADLLRQLSEPVDPGGRTRKIHVIAHSMGNRVFLGAARLFDLEAKGTTAGRKPFGHVALAAPDVDAATFAALVPSVIRRAETTTLYYCQADRALLASRTVHMNKPVGLGPFFVDGLDTINCDHANTSLLGHGYFASEHPLLNDLKLMILFNQDPDHRLPPLAHPTMVLGYRHWAFLPVR